MFAQVRAPAGIASVVATAGHGIRIDQTTSTRARAFRRGARQHQSAELDDAHSWPEPAGVGGWPEWGGMGGEPESDRVGGQRELDRAPGQAKQDAPAVQGSGELGSGSVYVLALMAVVVLTGLAALTVGTALVVRHRAAAAADLSAISAATHAFEGDVAACRNAAQVAAAQSARLASCRISGSVATVTVQVSLPGPLARLGAATGHARAGPAAVAPSGGAGDGAEAAAGPLRARDEDPRPERCVAGGRSGEGGGPAASVLLAGGRGQQGATGGAGG